MLKEIPVSLTVYVSYSREINVDRISAAVFNFASEL